MEQLCEQLMEIDLKFWQEVWIDITEIYTYLTILDFEFFRDRICSLHMIDDAFGRGA